LPLRAARIVGPPRTLDSDCSNSELISSCSIFGIRTMFRVDWISPTGNDADRPAPHQTKHPVANDACGSSRSSRFRPELSAQPIGRARRPSGVLWIVLSIDSPDGGAVEWPMSRRSGCGRLMTPSPGSPPSARSPAALRPATAVSPGAVTQDPFPATSRWRSAGAGPPCEAAGAGLEASWKVLLRQTPRTSFALREAARFAASMASKTDVNL
jgi:hypothetical protein